ncbi:hypothetical protein RQM59_10485 [Flavobacteriaceae bacterium S356]|uniref:NTR domain-containing protein n=1 Tax=Asprobacillus argus TaxID=3076534 RepID=A0ABU3LGI3_9FLAO|nr:hypothetical protein [Flavobacteriaceae bacterium S356]
MKKNVTILFLLVSASVVACSCIRSKFSKKHVDNASYIIKGEVLKVSHDKKNWQNIITFRVDDAIKGNTKKTVKIRTAQDSAACGLYVQKNDQWFLFVYELEGQMHIGLCDKNIRYNRRPGESRALRKKNCKIIKNYQKKIKEFRNE